MQVLLSDVDVVTVQNPFDHIYRDRRGAKAGPHLPCQGRDLGWLLLGRLQQLYVARWGIEGFGCWAWCKESTQHIAGALGRL